MFDAKSKRSVAGSAAFGSNELAEGFVRKGQRLIVQACRERGDGLQGAAEARRAVDRRREGDRRGANVRAAATTDHVQVVDVNTPTRG